MPIKVLVVDDHALFRRGIVTVLTGYDDLVVAGEATDGLDAINKAKEIVPDVILMDLNMPRLDGLRAVQVLQTEMPQINVLVLTVSDAEADLFAAMKFGAKGYILKNTEPEDLLHAVSLIAQGGVIVSPLMAAKLLAEFSSAVTSAEKKEEPQAETVVSGREIEILHFVAQGATNKQIADSLVISENTVKTHLRNIMEKLHLANRSQAAAYAVKMGLVQFKDQNTT